MDDRQAERDRLVHDLLSKKPKWSKKKQQPKERPADAKKPPAETVEPAKPAKAKPKPKPEPVEKE